MDQKNFVNFHILISHSPSCLNRDDMNMQKTAVFGGVRRVRISSQSLKRAIRTSDYYKASFDRSTRTRFLVERMTNEALSSAKDEAEKKNIETTALYIAALIEGKTKPEDIKKYKRADSGRIEHQVMPFHSTEIKGIKSIFANALAKPANDKIDFIKSEIKTFEEQEKSKITLDVALSGRMAPSEILYDMDGALAVAHVITTHAVDGDIDWFTAVDDLVADAGEVGAGHLNTQEFSAGVFYRYASLNIQQLQENLGGASRERALEIAKHVLHLLATVVPSAKQQTFAAHNPADFALVSFADQPISLANAFEAPIKNGRNSGFLQPSMERLTEYWETINSKYGLHEQAAAFSLREIDLPRALKSCATLPDLETWIETGGHA
jgi:CRISPR system Cascade subunit CasC